MPPEIVYIAGKDPLGQLGGHSSYVRAHARAARRLGFEPHIFCLGAATRTQDCELGRLHQVATRMTVRSAAVPVTGPALTRAIVAHVADRPGPHLLHGFGMWGWVGVRAAARLSRRGIRALTVSSIYTTYEHEFRAKIVGARNAGNVASVVRAATEYVGLHLGLARCERTLLRRSHRVTANYASVRRLAEAVHGGELPVRLLPYCSDQAFVRGGDERPAAPPEIARLRPADAPLIVAVSRHDPRKGLATLLRALARLQAAHVPFRACLVGGGELLDTHRRLARQLGLGDNVLIAGWVADPHAFLTRADVFILPSLQEGSGSVSLLEALQAGAAVVASGIDGIAEDVTDGESALLVAPGSAAGVAAALRRLLDDPALRQRLARRGHQLYRERFSPEALTAALGELYRGLDFPAGGPSPGH